MPFRKPEIPSLKDLLGVALALLACGTLLMAPTARSSDAQPPNLMTYQGFLVDADNKPLAPDNPANYPVVFRIYDSATDGNLLWSEEQIVTIDKGNFSVLLGEGNQHANETRPLLSTVFSMNGTASDRFLGITVTLSGTPTEIRPRLRLLPAPYAFLARHAHALVNNSGEAIVSAGSGNQLIVAGKVTALELAGGGAALTGLNANYVAVGTLDDGRLSGNVARRDVGNAFNGINTFNTAVGIRTQPLHALHVKQDDDKVVALFQSSSKLGAGLSLSNTSPGGSRWNIFSTGPESTVGADRFIIQRDGITSGNLGNVVVISSGRLHLNGVLASSEGISTSGRIYVDPAGMPHGSGTTVKWNTATGFLERDSSSRRYKENITPLKDDFSRLLQVEPRTYTRSENPGRLEIGYIAEEFHDLGLRKLVDYDREGRPDGINYDKICLYLNENAKRQQRELADLQARHEAQTEVIASQRRELDDLKTRLNSLERLLLTVAKPAMVPEAAGTTTAPATLSQVGR